MDIPRDAPKSRKKLLYGGGAVLLLIVLTVAVSGLEPAVPSVERSRVVLDTVRRGLMLRQVRAPGSLLPERIRYVPAVTAGRVERKLVEPGSMVEAGTVLLELSNPEVQLELLEAQRQLSAAEQELVRLRTSLETQRLNQAGVVATTKAQYLEAKRNGEVADELVRTGRVSRTEAATAMERAEELATRYSIEQEQLKILTESMQPQLAVQEGQKRRLEDIVSFQRDRIASMRVPAGMNGVLRDLALEEGQWVLPGQTMAIVVDPTRLKGALRVPQVQARDVAIGQRVLIDTRTDTIIGRVARIDPAVDAGAVTVDIALEGELPQGVRPDLAVDGTIELERLPDVIHVGRPAYGQAESTIGLFRLLPDGRTAERIRVRLGRGSVNEIQILEGLAVGDVVILSDMAQWDQQDRIRLK